MKFASLFLILFAVAAASQAAGSDDDDVTLSSSVEPMFVAGELQGCSAVFDVGHSDFQYQQGKIVHISGSLNFSTSERTGPIVYLKLGIEPLGDTKFIAPTDAYLIQGTETNKSDLLMSISAENPGFRIFGYRIGDDTISSLIAIGQTGKLSVGYAMTRGGMLSVATANIRVKNLNLDNPSASELDSTAQSRWLSCIAKVSDAAKKRLEREYPKGAD